MPFLALLKLIPLKDWVYVAAIVAIVSVFTWYTVHERHVGATHELAAVTKAGHKAEDAAEQRIKTLTDQHAIDVAKVEENYENLLKTADDQRVSDLQRLRNADAYRKTHSVLGSTSGAGTQTTSGTTCLNPLESISAELADALRRDDAALAACYVERDSVTGK